VKTTKDPRPLTGKAAIKAELHKVRAANEKAHAKRMADCTEAGLDPDRGQLDACRARAQGIAEAGRGRPGLWSGGLAG
jgi:hypothetical protein